MLTKKPDPDVTIDDSRFRREVILRAWDSELAKLRENPGDNRSERWRQPLWLVPMRPKTDDSARLPLAVLGGLMFLAAVVGGVLAVCR